MSVSNEKFMVSIRDKAKKRDIWTAETLMYAMEVCEDERLKLAMNLSFSCSLYGSVNFFFLSIRNPSV